MFRFVLSPQPTPAKLYLMKRSKWAATEEIAKLDHIEVCPKAMELTQTIAKRISSDGGGALIIDYGMDAVVSDSLQVCFLSVLVLWCWFYYIGNDSSCCCF
jgi:NADH dehydrogenase [ubiquinone] 1 alpha subcomplex assembly factor 7